MFVWTFLKAVFWGSKAGYVSKYPIVVPGNFRGAEVSMKTKFTIRNQICRIQNFSPKNVSAIRFTNNSITLFSIIRTNTIFKNSLHEKTKKVVIAILIYLGLSASKLEIGFRNFKILLKEMKSNVLVTSIPSD
jgi:hypothetical protein